MRKLGIPTPAVAYPPRLPGYFGAFACGSSSFFRTLGCALRSEGNSIEPITLPGETRNEGQRGGVLVAEELCHPRRHDFCGFCGTKAGASERASREGRTVQRGASYRERKRGRGERNVKVSLPGV